MINFDMITIGKYKTSKDKIINLRTGLGAVHDGVAAVNREGVLQLIQTLFRCLIARIDHPPRKEWEFVNLIQKTFIYFVREVSLCN